MDLREKIARAICGNWIVGDDRPWQQWVEEADAVLEVLAQHIEQVESLRDELKKAKDQAEHFEREWYLRGDEIERLRGELDEIKQVEFPRRVHKVADGWRGKCERLQAEIEAMKQQEPVARYNWNKGKVEWLQKWDFGRMNMQPLYLSPGAQSAVPDGWIRAIDEEMVGAHIGVVDASDDYATAKEKLNALICWHVAVATDPAVNGGWQLVPKELTHYMSRAMHEEVSRGSWETIWTAALEAAPKPGDTNATL